MIQIDNIISEFDKLSDDVDLDVEQIEQRIAYIESLISTVSTFIDEFKFKYVHETDEKLKNTWRNKIVFLTGESSKLLDILQKFLALREAYRKNKLAVSTQKYRTVMQAQDREKGGSFDFTKLFTFLSRMEQQEDNQIINSNKDDTIEEDIYQLD